VRISTSVGGGPEGTRRLSARKALPAVFQLSVLRGRLVSAAATATTPDAGVRSDRNAYLRYDGDSRVVPRPGPSHATTADHHHRFRHDVRDGGIDRHRDVSHGGMATEVQ
jgi:hypothetical protein